MFDERRNSQPEDFIEVGKLYKLKQRCRFRSLGNDKKPANLTEAFIGASRRLRDFEPGHILMYLGQVPDAWLIVRETFLSQDGEVVTPQVTMGKQLLSSFLEKQETSTTQDIV
jgi:hypothetical protein